MSEANDSTIFLLKIIQRTSANALFRWGSGMLFWLRVVARAWRLGSVPFALRMPTGKPVPAAGLSGEMTGWSDYVWAWRLSEAGNGVVS